MRLWGIGAVEDQQLAGAVMKIGGGLFLWAIVIYPVLQEVRGRHADSLRLSARHARCPTPRSSATTRCRSRPPTSSASSPPANATRAALGVGRIAKRGTLEHPRTVSLARVIDVRLIRNDYEGVRAALARRNSDEVLAALERAAALDARLREITSRARRAPRPGQRSCRSRSANTAGNGDADAAEALQDESRADRRARRSGSPTSTTRSARRSARSCSSSPTSPTPKRPTDAATPTIRSCKGPFLPEHVRRRTSACRTGRRHRRSASSTTSAATKIAQSMWTMQRGAGATLARALCQLRTRPQRRRLRGDPATHAGVDRHADVDRSAPQVRRRRVRHRARRPVVHPHRRGAAHVDLRRRDPRRGRSCRCGSWRTARATAARPGRPGATPAACSRSHEFDKVEILALATAEQAPALLDEMVGRAEAHDRRPRPAVPDHRDLHGRHGPEPPPQLRHRGLRARCRPVARGVVGELVQRLPGAPRQHPLPPARCDGKPQKGTAARAHAQRVGARRAAGVGGDRRELPQRRRLDHGARRALRPYMRGIITIT